MEIGKGHVPPTNRYLLCAFVRRETHVRTHITVLGWLHIILNGVHLLGGLLILLGFSSLGFLGAIVGALPALPILGGIGGFIFLLVAPVYLPGMIVGWGLLQFAPWARI